MFFMFSREAYLQLNKVVGEYKTAIKILYNTIFFYHKILLNFNKNLFQALCGGTVEVPTLTGEKLSVCLKNVIEPNSERRFPGHGLPVPKEATRRGDLIVVFSINFPDSLTDSAKEALMDCLPS